MGASLHNLEIIVLQFKNHKIIITLKKKNGRSDILYYEITINMICKYSCQYIEIKLQ